MRPIWPGGPLGRPPHSGPVLGWQRGRAPKGVVRERVVKSVVRQQPELRNWIVLIATFVPTACRTSDSAHVGRRSGSSKELNPQPIAPVVYPSEGDLVIHFKAPSAPASVVIEVSDDGRAVCYAHLNGKSRRASYEASTDLPDAFLLEQIHELTNLG